MSWRHSERGFTLIEVLVVLALLAALVAIVSPTLFNQLDRGDSTQVAGDLTSVGSAIKSFRVDVSPVFPGDAEDLVTAIEAGTDEDVEGTTYNSGQANRWSGPYLEVEFTQGTDPAASGTVAFGTGFSGDVLADFWVFNSASTATQNTDAGPSNTTGDWVAVRIDGLTAAEFDAIDEVVDGEIGQGAGRFQWDGTNTIAYYLAAQR